MLNRPLLFIEEHRNPLIAEKKFKEGKNGTKSNVQNW